MRIVFALLAALLFCTRVESQSAAAGSPAPPGSVGAATVTANLSSTSSTIPTNFLGHRGGVQDFVNGLFQGNTGANGSYAAIIALLGGNCQFSLGGNDAEQATAPTITAGMASALNTFMAAAGCTSLIYDLDSIANNSAAAATTASTLATAIGVGNITFQVGNEPSTNWTPANYITVFNSYYSAVTTAVSGAKFGSTDDGMLPGSMNLQSVFTSLTPGIAGLNMISTHFYAFCVGTYPGAVPSTLLQAVITNYPFNTNVSFVGSTKLVMTETNTICGHGQSGMSDRMMAATYFLNEAITLLANGYSGLIVQNYWLGSQFYNMVSLNGDSTYTPTPIFYGVFLFSKLQGQQQVANTITGSANIRAIATKGSNGNANIVVVNNDTSRTSFVKPAQSSAWTTANVLQIKGGGCSESSPTIGGASFGESGAWSGSSFSISNGASIGLGPCEAALISIQP